MRSQRPRGSITRAAVLDAALAIADDVGSDALTLRALAKQVGAPTMTLYTHFASKEELLDLMGAEVGRRLWADAGNLTWEAEVASLCHHMHGLLVAHPRWAPLLARPLPAMPVALRERIMALMIKDGIALEEAFTAVSNAGLLAVGLTLAQITLRDATGNSSLEARFERLKARCEQPSFGEQNPLTCAALSSVGRVDLNDNFSAAVRAFIEGLKAARAPSGPSAEGAVA